MEDLTIRRIIEKVEAGQIRIPVFQRGFVWDAERVAYLMDSIYKGYPLGAVILWRTKQALNSERKLGPFELPEHEPDYPLDYVLDGQQRLTSIYGVFQTSVQPEGDDSWTHVYYDFESSNDAQDTQFIVLKPQDADATRYFPIKTFFDVSGYRQATNGLTAEKLKVIDTVYSAFKEAKIPAQQIETDDRAKVAIVFERVNRLGVELDIFQLLSAWTWSEDFDLQTQFSDLSDELAPFGFQSIGEDSNLLLRCCAAVIAQEASPDKLIALSGSEVRDKFSEIKNGVKGAIDFLRANLNVESLKNLPYSTLIVPLTVFFAVPDGKQLRMTAEQRDRLIRWFWRACFSRRYSAGVIRNLKRDIDEMTKLRMKQRSLIDDIQVKVDPSFFSNQLFNVNSVTTRILILMLANNTPRSFISGQAIRLAPVLQAYNRNEFHHLYPKAYLLAENYPLQEINTLANFTIISKADNNKLGGNKPSKYKLKMDSNHIDAILNSAFVPENLFSDDYQEFISERTGYLVREAEKLIN